MLCFIAGIFCISLLAVLGLLSFIVLFFVVLISRIVQVVDCDFRNSGVCFYRIMTGLVDSQIQGGLGLSYYVIEPLLQRL